MFALTLEGADHTLHATVVPAGQAVLRHFIWASQIFDKPETQIWRQLASMVSAIPQSRRSFQSIPRRQRNDLRKKSISQCASNGSQALPGCALVLQLLECAGVRANQRLPGKLLRWTERPVRSQQVWRPDLWVRYRSERYGGPAGGIQAAFQWECTGGGRNV